MDELDMYKAIKSLDTMHKQEEVSRLNQSALAAAAGQGNKDANRKIKKLTMEFNQEEKRKQSRQTIRSGKGVLSTGRMLTPEEINQLSGSVNHGK